MAADGKERGLKLRVGGLILVALVLAGGFIVLLGGFSFRKGYRLLVDFDFVGSLQPGAPVKVSGIKVGKVEEVEFLGGKLDPDVGRRVQVRATLWVEERARDAIREDAEFFINTQGVLGEQYLEVVPGDYTLGVLPEGKVKRHGHDPPRTDLIVARLYEFLELISKLLSQNKDVIRDFLQSGASMVRSLDGLLKENHVEIARLLKNVDKLLQDAGGLIASVKRGVGDGDKLQKTLANVEALSGSIRRDIDPLTAKLKKALDGVENITSVVGPGEKQKLIKALDELITLSQKVDGVTSDVQAIVGDVKKGRGTAGALIVDQQIYDDLKELVRDLKRNPWKFFWKE